MTTEARTSLLAGLVTDLRDETSDLLALVSALDEDRWRTATPAVGWTVQDQVGHLAFFDDATLLSMRDPDAFRRQRDDLVGLGDGFPDVVAERHRDLTGEQCLEWFTRSRTRLLDGYLAVDASLRLPWYGPDMGLASSVTARLMETWAHGLDVADALGALRPPTTRTRHVADLGVRTFAFSFRLRGRSVPDVGVRVELAGPGGEQWSWGPADAVDRVRGSADGFCRVVTQRRHLDDTDLVVAGPVAAEWMSVAQAFAGGVGAGRAAVGSATTTGRGAS